MYIIDHNPTVSHGDVLIGLPSDGLHPCNQDLARSIFAEAGTPTDVPLPELGCTLAEEFCRPARDYEGSLRALSESGFPIKNVVSVTTGGLCGSLSRMLPENICGELYTTAIPVAPIFTLIQEKGGIPLREMFGTFNMGISHILAVSKDAAAAVYDALIRCGEQPHLIGKCVEGEKGVELW